SDPLQLGVIRNARPGDVLGRSIGTIGAVAAAIRVRDSVVLVDGIDLRLLTPKKGIGLGNKVAHTFWQYGRLKTSDLVASRVKRVGVVLNGVNATSRRKAAAYADAHDYVLDQFRKEADLAVDGTTALGTAQL